MDIKNLQENVSLANRTTFRIGGPARYFFEAKSGEDIKDAIAWANEKHLPFFILGGGSNLLVSDKGFDGLVIKIKIPDLKIFPEGEKCRVIADAGVLLAKIILETTRAGYSGAEWGFGIPGTVGGAIFGNAHRLGQAMDQVVEKVKVLDLESFKIKDISKEECDFGYGESRFKKTKEIILSAELLFLKKDEAEINKTLQEARQIVLDAPRFPSAGCVFKNYETAGENDALLKNHPELAPRVRGGKIGVGYLIDQCGLKGKKIGGAKIWEGHANYIINESGAKAADVCELIKECQEAVKNKYGFILEEEIRHL
ncbi:MAG: UDP-N-acetylmuramate dehydrogenase [Candidatus Portnoybacteria bacterium]|nr:UDP-N-acetylmuramate dehydrogenase [Candidatus Portnoybacteria bacterium]